jgi:hypothetical protein
MDRHTYMYSYLGVTVVSALVGVWELDLTGCRNIINVDALSNVDVIHTHDADEDGDDYEDDFINENVHTYMFDTDDSNNND